MKYPGTTIARTAAIASAEKYLPSIAKAVERAANRELKRLEREAILCDVSLPICTPSRRPITSRAIPVESDSVFSPRPEYAPIECEHIGDE